MPLIKAKCTNCGANLEVDRAKDAAICPYCGTAYVVDDAICHYNATNNIINNIHAENAYIFGVQESGFEVKAGELKSYKGSGRLIVIPPNVAIIGRGAFKDLKGLKEVVITENVKAIEPSAFAGCSSLERVTLIDGIEIIGETAFSGCNSLKEIELPQSVIRIENDAFAGCSSLERVTLSDGIEFLGWSVFAGCTNLKQIELPGSVKEFGNTFRGDRVGNTFRNCIGLEKVVLNEGITNISRNAFIGCKNLIEICIPNSVKVIESSAFEDCSRLNTVLLPQSLVQIQVAAFRRSGLTSINIPDSVTQIGSWAFSECHNLTYVRIPSSLDLGEATMEYEWEDNTRIDDCSVFGRCEKLTQIDASEEWKRKNWKHAVCLKSYGEKKGCYIATCVYGSYDCPNVWVLRRFRDSVLAQSWCGCMFIRLYYSFSPWLVRQFGNSVCIKQIWKKCLDKLITYLKDNGILDTFYVDE